MNEIEKRLNATVDILTWLDQRIAAQVEHQLAQRLAQEREYWRCTVSDLIAAERERSNASVEELRRKLIDWVHNKVVDVVTKSVSDGLDRAFDRIDARLSDLDRRLAVPIMHRSDDDDGEPPASKH